MRIEAPAAAHRWRDSLYWVTYDGTAPKENAVTTSQISLLALISVGGIGILFIGASMLMKAAARKKARPVPP